LIPVVGLAVTLAIELALGLRGQYVFNSALLILALSIAVLCVGGFVVTYLSAKGYLLTGSLTLLFITLAFIVAVGGAIVSAVFANFSANESVTAAAIALLLFSALQLLSSVQASFRSVPIGSEHRKFRLILASSGVFVLFLIMALLIGYGALPSFFMNGIGVTLVDQVVYAIVVLFFGVGSVLFLRQYLKSNSNVLYWYTLALVLDAIGAFGLTLQVRFSDIVVWTGRLGIYLAIVYFLIALRSSRKNSGDV
jgi:hypothetical protein